jgi:hypothetical protein
MSKQQRKMSKGIGGGFGGGAEYGGLEMGGLEMGGTVGTRKGTAVDVGAMLGGMSEHEIKAMRKKSNAAPLDVFSSADVFSTGADPRVVPRHMGGGSMSQGLLSAMSDLGADVSGKVPVDLGAGTDPAAAAGVTSAGGGYSNPMMDRAGTGASGGETDGQQRNFVMNALAELGAAPPRTSMPQGVAPRHMGVVGAQESPTMHATTPRKKVGGGSMIAEATEVDGGGAGEGEGEEVAEADPRKFLL